MRITGFNESRKANIETYYKANCLCGTVFMFAGKEVDEHYDIKCPECGRTLNLNNNVVLHKEKGSKTVVVRDLIEEINENEYNGINSHTEEIDIKKQLLDSLFKKHFGN